MMTWHEMISDIERTLCCLNQNKGATLAEWKIDRSYFNRLRLRDNSAGDEYKGRIIALRTYLMEQRKLKEKYLFSKLA